MDFDSLLFCIIHSSNWVGDILFSWYKGSYFEICVVNRFNFVISTRQQLQMWLVQVLVSNFSPFLYCVLMTVNVNCLPLATLITQQKNCFFFRTRNNTLGNIPVCRWRPQCTTGIIFSEFYLNTCENFQFQNNTQIQN